MTEDERLRHRQRKAEAERDRTWTGEDCDSRGHDADREIADYTAQAAAQAAIGLAVELIRSGLTREEIVPILVRLRADPLMVVLESDLIEADIRIDFALAMCGVPVPGLWTDDDDEDVEENEDG